MLAGEAVVAIWNGIEPEAREQFYDWHVNEHMPERVGIPGFRRGRRLHRRRCRHPSGILHALRSRYDAGAARLRIRRPAERSDPGDQGHDSEIHRYVPGVVARAGQPRARHGRCAADDPVRLRRAASDRRPRHGARRRTGPARDRRASVSGDAAASLVRTTETKDRTDIQPPPVCFIMVEATDPEALTDILLERALLGAGATGPFVRGTYRLEYVRVKTAFAS